jgi:glutaredoxin-related protein
MIEVYNYKNQIHIKEKFIEIKNKINNMKNFLYLKYIRYKIKKIKNINDIVRLIKNINYYNNDNDDISYVMNIIIESLFLEEIKEIELQKISLIQQEYEKDLNIQGYAISVLWISINYFLINK